MTDSDTTLATPAPAPEPTVADAAGGPEGQMNAARETVSRAELDKVIRERQAAKQRARAAEAQAAELHRRLAELEGSAGLDLAGVGVAANGAATAPEEDDLAGTARFSAADDAGVANRAGEMPRAGEAGTAGISNAGGNVAANIAATAPNSGTAPISATAPDSPPSPDSAPADHGLRRRLAARERQLAALLRDQRLREAALTAGAVNPDQVVALLRQHVRMVEQDDGQFAPRFLDDRGAAAFDEAGRPVDAAGFVRAYLSRPENANLVRAGSLGGSGARLSGTPGGPDGLPVTLEEFNALDPRDRRRVALRLSRRQREALLGLGTHRGAGYL